MSGNLATAVVTTKNLLTSGWKPVTTAVRPVLISLCVTAGIGRGTFPAAGHGAGGGAEKKTSTLPQEYNGVLGFE